MAFRRNSDRIVKRAKRREKQPTLKELKRRLTVLEERMGLHGPDFNPPHCPPRPD